MSGGRWTKKVPEKIYFIGNGEGWVQGPYVNIPRGYKKGDKNLKSFELKEDDKEEVRKGETWEEFCERHKFTKEFFAINDLSVLVYFSTTYAYEQNCS